MYGEEERTFYDDRFDMFPLEVTAVWQAMNSAGPTFREDLDELDIDLVLLESTSPSAQIISLDPDVAGRCSTMAAGCCPAAGCRPRRSARELLSDRRLDPGREGGAGRWPAPPCCRRVD